MKKIISIITLSMVLLMTMNCRLSIKNIDVTKVLGTYEGVYTAGQLKVLLQMELKQDSGKKIKGYVKAKGGALGNNLIKMADIKGAFTGSILDCTVTINIPDEDAKKLIPKTNLDTINNLPTNNKTAALQQAIKDTKETFHKVAETIMKPGKKEIKVISDGTLLQFDINEKTTIILTKTKK